MLAVGLAAAPAAPAFAVAEGILSATAEPNDPASIVAGRSIQFAFTVTNTGDVDLTDVALTTVAFDGAGPQPVLTCPSADVPVGESLTCTSSYVITQTDVDAGGIRYLVGGGAGSAEGDVAFDVVNANLASIREPGMTLVKSATPSDGVVAGSSIAYAFLATNTGTVTLRNLSIAEQAFTGTGDLSAITCPATELLPGASVICTAEYVATSGDEAVGSIVNTAIARADTPLETVAESAPSTATASSAVPPTQPGPVQIPPRPTATTAHDTLPATGTDRLHSTALLVAAGALLLAGVAVAITSRRAARRR